MSSKSLTNRSHTGCPLKKSIKIIVDPPCHNQQTARLRKEHGDPFNKNYFGNHSESSNVTSSHTTGIAFLAAGTEQFQHQESCAAVAVIHCILLILPRIFCKLLDRNNFEESGKSYKHLQWSMNKSGWLHCLELDCFKVGDTHLAFHYNLAVFNVCYYLENLEKIS